MYVAQIFAKQQCKELLYVPFQQAFIHILY